MSESNKAAPAGTSEPKNLTMDDLQGVIATAIKDAMPGELKSLREEIDKVSRKAVFTDGEPQTGEYQAVDGSIIDLGFAVKNMGRMSGMRLTGDPRMDGHQLGMAFMQLGGPFKKLSPEMETFAKLCLTGMQPGRLSTSGIDIPAHNAKVYEQLTKIGAVTPNMKQAGMNEGVLADGGALVPVMYPATIIEFATQASQILPRCWRMPMTTNVMRIPRLQQAAGSYFGGVQIYSPDEGALKESTKPTLERLTFTAKKLAGIIYLTDELIADSLINVVNYITGLYTRAFQYELERRVINGTGVGPILGILGPGTGITTVARQTAGTIGYRDVINLDSIIDENFSDLAWLTRKSSQNTLMSIVDLNNRPIFLADYAVFTGQKVSGNTMITYPVYRTRNVPAIGTKGDLIIADLNWFMIAMRQDMTVAASEHVRFLYDEMTLRFVMRLDGRPVVPSAFSYLDDAASS